MGTATIVDPVLQRRDLYRDQFGLPVEVKPDDSVITLEGGTQSGVRAIALVPQLGKRLLPALANLDFDVPVISEERKHAGRHWKLLTLSAPDDLTWYTTSGRRLERELPGLRLWPTSQITLPTPSDPRRVWLNLPDQDQMSPYRDLGEALIHILSEPSSGRAPWY
ncbi:hypothetical protein IU485_27650 [Nocardia cyriacigeorgica]|uniref:hypothetical protein n=1 Tax=Nocardia cyriacigeorgica TaxID=135487 RepID=UPI001895A0BF|nr:hypothetical protein [Nocardia cyriacigeorgica]MBF6085152.1 hypothetical protein [Nocardia cyriacigeorgica]